ncbi:hypothetical protein ACET3Z_007033 [Daucus carota]
MYDKQGRETWILKIENRNNHFSSTKTKHKTTLQLIFTPLPQLHTHLHTDKICLASISSQMATATSMATTAVFSPRLPTTPSSALPYLPPRFSTSPFSASIKLSSGSRRSQFQIKATSQESSPDDGGEILADLKEKWDAVENKSTVLIYGGGALVGLWLSATLVGAINSIPLLPKILELVGLGYTGWFVYRYLLFKSSRKELASDIESLKKKIAGTE